MKNIRLVLLLGIIAQTSSQTQAQPAPTGQTNAVRVQRTTPATAGRPTMTAPPAPAAPAAPGATATTPAAPAPGTPVTTTPAGRATPGATGAIDPNEELTPIKVENMPLQQFIDLYAETVNKTVLRSSQIPATQPVTLTTRGDITKADAITAMETVLAMNGITIVPVGDKFIKVVPGAEAGTTGAAFSTKDIADLPIAGRYVTQVVPLKHISTQDASTAIAPFASLKTGVNVIPIPASNTLILRDYSENVKRMVEVIDKIDRVVEMEFKPELIPIKYALAEEIAQVLGSLTASGPGLTVGSASRSAFSPGGSRTGTTTGTQQPGMTTQQNQGATGIGSSALSNRSNFGSRLSNIMNRAGGSGEFQILGEAKIIADTRSNSLLIFANEQDMVMIKHIISQLDVVLAQVLIEALIMEVSLNDSMNVGVSYLQQPQTFGNTRTAGGFLSTTNGFLSPFAGSLLSAGTNGGALASSGLPSGFSYFARINEDFDVALQASATDGRVNVLSRPRVQTSHAVPANLFVGQTVPYVTGTYFGGTTSGSSSQYQQKEVGITIDVLPLINPDGLVVMDIQQNIEQLGVPTTIDGNPVPTTTKRQATAKVAVRDRETVVLGGFISTSKQNSKSGIPFLMNIPGLGALFRSRNEATDRTELMVLIRPTVLPTPEAAAVAATAELENLPGVRQTEFEIRQEERKRQERVDAEMRKKLGLKEPAPRKKK